MSERDRKIIKEAFNLDVPGDGAKPHNSVRQGAYLRRYPTPNLPLKGAVQAPKSLQDYQSQSQSHSIIFIIISLLSIIIFNLFYME